MFLEKKAQQENIGFFQVVEKYIGVFIHKTQSERRSLQASEKAHLTFRPAILILFPMDPSRRIARDLKACLVAGPILLLIWLLRGCW